MTPAELAEIEARAKAATAGPWTMYGAHTQGQLWTLYSEKAGGPFGGGMILNSIPSHDDHDDGAFLREADARFCMTARDAVTALLAEVRADKAAMCKVSAAIEGLLAGTLPDDQRIFFDDKLESLRKRLDGWR